MTEAIINILEDDSDVNALISGKGYPIDAPQGTALPYIVIEQVGRESNHTKDGASELDIGFLNVISYDNTYVDTRNLAEKCKIALHGHSSGVESTSGQNIDSVRLDDENEDKVDERLFEIEQTYRVRRK